MEWIGLERIGMDYGETDWIGIGLGGMYYNGEQRI